MKTVYVETSVLSARFDPREDLASRYQREQTSAWWEASSPHCEIVSSYAVLAELLRAPFPGQEEAIRLLETLPLVPVTEEVEGVAIVYQRHFLMPKERLGDAVHMALASVHELDFLLTWNCGHLANPNKLEHLRVLNMRLGLVTPTVITPQMPIEGPG